MINITFEAPCLESDLAVTLRTSFARMAPTHDDRSAGLNREGRVSETPDAGDGAIAFARVWGELFLSARLTSVRHGCQSPARMTSFAVGHNDDPWGSEPTVARLVAAYAEYVREEQPAQGHEAAAPNRPWRHVFVWSLDRFSRGMYRNISDSRLQRERRAAPSRCTKSTRTSRSCCGGGNAENGTSTASAGSAQGRTRMEKASDSEDAD